MNAATAKFELNEGTIAAIIGTWYSETPEGYAAGVEAFQKWLDEQREDAHIEALEGALGQLRLREEFLEGTGADDMLVSGFRAARWRMQHATTTLSALYKNRRRFAARDAAKAARNS